MVFPGFFAVHRFYPGRPGTAILQMFSYLILIGFIWGLIDAFLIPGMIQQHKDDVRRRLFNEAVLANKV